MARGDERGGEGAQLFGGEFKHQSCPKGANVVQREVIDDRCELRRGVKDVWISNRSRWLSELLAELFLSPLLTFPTLSVMMSVTWSTSAWAAAKGVISAILRRSEIDCFAFKVNAEHGIIRLANFQ